MDHRYGVAKSNLEQTIDLASQQPAEPGKRSSLPTHCAHTVVSNSVTIQDQNKIGEVTHVDPDAKIGK